VNLCHLFLRLFLSLFPFSSPRVDPKKGKSFSDPLKVMVDDLAPPSSFPPFIARVHASTFHGQIMIIFHPPPPPPFPSYMEKSRPHSSFHAPTLLPSDREPAIPLILEQGVIWFLPFPRLILEKRGLHPPLPPIILRHESDDAFSLWGPMQVNRNISPPSFPSFSRFSLSRRNRASFQGRYNSKNSRPCFSRQSYLKLLWNQGND